MKNHFLVTVSDLDGSRHYMLRKSLKRRALYAFAAALAFVAGSVGYNYLQHQQVETLHGLNAGLERESALMHGRNTRLIRESAARDRQARAISRELSEIERIIGLRDAADDDDGPPRDAPLNLAERAEMAAFSARQENILLTSIPNGFPTESTVITSRYGPRIHPVTKVRHFHNGVDIRAKGHVPVYATADGIVRAADHSRLSGNRVVVRHNFGFESYYAHLHKLQATPGDVVRKGDVIGLSGNSGQSAGPHLHYEIRYLGKPLNPSAFLDWRFGSHEIFTQVEEVKWPSLLSLINQRITHPMFQLSLLDPASKEP